MHARNCCVSKAHIWGAGAAGCAGGAAAAGASEPRMEPEMALPSIEPATEPAIDEPKVPIIEGPWEGCWCIGGGAACGTGAGAARGAGAAAGGERLLLRPKPMFSELCQNTRVRARCDSAAGAGQTLDDR